MGVVRMQVDRSMLEGIHDPQQVVPLRTGSSVRPSAVVMSAPDVGKEGAILIRPLTRKTSVHLSTHPQAQTRSRLAQIESQKRAVSVGSGGRENAD